MVDTARMLRRPVFLATVVMAMGLAACGSGSGGTTNAPNAPSKSSDRYTIPASTSPTSCTTYLSGYDAQVEFESQSYNVQAACQNWIRNNASQDQELWTEQAPAQPSDLTQVCALNSADGSVQAFIRDSGGDVYGTGACTGLISGGWTEVASNTG